MSNGWFMIKDILAPTYPVLQRDSFEPTEGTGFNLSFPQNFANQRNPAGSHARHYDFLHNVEQ